MKNIDATAAAMNIERFIFWSPFKRVVAAAAFGEPIIPAPLHLPFCQ
jgi:hypothetical protein